ncbi:response regulator [Candidatus Bathyarchaeota archaeon]|jgi:twitching motility two-component system response regulator PilH|nr:response regulator [Candidatus Bathyarchaeota archaeon]MBT7619105.1 response regulator [Calditrichota bacterium]MBT4320643.1 response regulator [Candidatus Bathyarchaeota archaeon]MBT4424140.1 response regulator [Candidatus Bathyarchaeota archaeon]MBT6604085.1 response regulator [Candidatus Bathyarchaeota archaeon]
MDIKLDPEIKKILIVDDNTDFIVLTKRILSNYETSVVSVTNGKKALEYVNKELPDIIILDVLMTKMNGFKVCEALKLNPKTKGVPVIMCSSLGVGVRSMQDRSTKADGYLGKPFTANELIKKINSTIKKVQARQIKNETSD